MLSKINRFKQWRGSKSDAEQHILNTALLISDYVNSVDNLEVIKANAKTKYNDFNQYKVRPWGVAVFVKLFLDEAIDQLPETAEKEKALLTHSSEVISTLYGNWRDNTAGNILALIGDIEKLLVLDRVPFADKNQYKTFLLSSCMLFHIIQLAIAEIESDWKVRFVVAAFLDLGQIKPKLEFFLLKIEERMEQLQQPKQITDKAPDPLKPAKDLLSKRYFKVLGIDSGGSAKQQKTTKSYVLKTQAPGASRLQRAEKKPIKRSILDSLAVLEADIEKVASGIFNLIDQRNKKGYLEAKIEKVEKLLLFAEENDQKIAGRKYFLDFIAEHAELFQTLLENTEDIRKQQLLEKIKQLKSIGESSDLTSGVMHGVSWVASPITVVYRTATPQSLQNMIATALPSTLDGVCKAELKEVANACLLDLKSKLKKKEHQIAAINNRFFNQDKELKWLIENESSERLAMLQKSNDVMKEAVQASSKLLATIKENSLFLHELQEKSQILSDFIRLHDGFFVKVSNVLAQYFACFKTKTAKIIDDAAALKIKVDGLVAEYQRTVNQGVRQIESIPCLDERIKTHIKGQFNAEEYEISQEKQNHTHPNKRTVRLLMNNLSRLFATRPQSTGEQINEIEDDEEKPVLACF